MRKFFKGGGIILMLLFACLISIEIFLEVTKSPEEEARKQRAAQAQALASLPTVTAAQLKEAYDANTVAADQKYKGKPFKITGTVAEISTDISGAPYITMIGENEFAQLQFSDEFAQLEFYDEFAQPQFYFSKNASNQLAKIEKGMRLTLLCRGKGDILKIPVSGNCQILQ